MGANSSSAATPAAASPNTINATKKNNAVKAPAPTAVTTALPPAVTEKPVSASATVGGWKANLGIPMKRKRKTARRSKNKKRSHRHRK